MEKATNLLSYSPRTGFTEGLRKFADWLEQLPVPSRSAGR
jgi:hypothetical protein